MYKETERCDLQARRKPSAEIRLNPGHPATLAQVVQRIKGDVALMSERVGNLSPQVEEIYIQTDQEKWFNLKIRVQGLRGRQPYQMVHTQVTSLRRNGVKLRPTPVFENTVIKNFPI